MTKKRFTRFINSMINLSSHISASIKEIPTKVKLSEYPLTKIDVSKIDGIQQGIPLFEGVKINDIAFLTKQLITLNLFRGCNVGCSHCLKNALAPKKGRESILFEDLERFLSGFKTLNERLGFNSLNGNEFFTTFDDSNPIDYPIKGLNRYHSLTEAIKLIYEKLRIPNLLVTSGWPLQNQNSYSQKTAEEIVDMIKKNPDSVRKVEVSISPFINKSNYALKMANVLATFLDLFKIGKADIIYRHSIDESTNTGEETTKRIYNEIYKNLQKITDSKLENIPELKPEVVTEFDKSHLIEPQGRGKKHFSFIRNMQLQRELLEDSRDWRSHTKDEQRQILQNYSAKCVDIDGSVYTIKPSCAEYINAPIEITIPTNIKLNYINTEPPNPIFSDIEV